MSSCEATRLCARSLSIKRAQRVGTRISSVERVASRKSGASAATSVGTFWIASVASSLKGCLDLSAALSESVWTCSMLAHFHVSLSESVIQCMSCACNGLMAPMNNVFVPVMYAVLCACFNLIYGPSIYMFNTAFSAARPWTGLQVFSRLRPALRTVK